MDEKKTIVIPIEADVSGFSNALKDLQGQSNAFGRAFSSTIKSAISGSKSFEDTLKGLALRMSEIALSSALKPLQNSVAKLFSTAIRSFGAAGSASVPVTPFAKGGVISSPSYFNAGSNLGVMGEAGAEAVMPLARGSDGRLGVRTSGQHAAPNITFNISTPDVQGFQKSEGQISAMLARTVVRGRRGL